MTARRRRPGLPLALGLAALALSGCASGPAAGSAASASPHASASLPPAVKAVIQTDHGPAGFAVADGALWVANHRGGTLQRIDPATNRVVATVVVGGELNVSPQDPSWSCTNVDSQVHKVDLVSARVASSTEAACNGGAVDVLGPTTWVVSGRDGSGAILLDSASGAVRRKVAIAGPGTGGPAVLVHGRVVVGGGPTAPQFTTDGKPLPVLPADLSWLVEPVAGELYRVPSSGEITRLDPVTLKPADVIAAPKHFDDWNWALTGDGHGHLWYRPDYTHLYQVDTATKKVTLLMTLPWEEAPTAIGYAFGSLWITNFDQDTVWRVDVTQ